MAYGQKLTERGKHRPMFPERETYVIDRTLAIYEKCGILTEEGEVRDATTLNDLCNALVDCNLLLFTNSIVSMPHFDAMVHSEHWTIMCTRRGQPTLAMLQYKKFRRYLVNVDSWHRECVDWSLLQFSRKLVNYVGVGVKPTFSSLGKETMRHTFSIYGLSKHTCCSIACENYLKKNGSGGIVATPGLLSRHDEVMLIDCKSCWPANMYGLPTGTNIWCKCKEDFYSFPIWFAECIVTIPYKLALGPFPVRKKGKVEYPTEPGTYRTFIWNFQADDCERVGCTVSPIMGYAWEGMTDELIAWVDRMYMKRQYIQHDEELCTSIKTITNSTPGLLNVSRDMHIVVPEERATEDDPPVICDGEPIDYFVHTENNPTLAIMPHWAYCTMARANSMVWRFAYPYAVEGRLVWMNYDGIIVLEKDGEHKTFTKKYTYEDMVASIGTWSYKFLHNCYIPAPRSYISDEEVIRPGVERAHRRAG